ncbi:solute carrier family 28 member 3 [Aplysia californica]|uniref:Sodium/nucleoside cotransporter n=1 Tax=Aplysia californica TaxID=6500 RepID=A0ABM0JAB9_APLCA|nr:solute carrier family 28 member 3 [Aplysia californica]XP_012946724.1 solute carrier family 28 member 3 [Aplysia californica]XP_035829715.1 solute carrier family 28 member 3 [Aplysia californica]
MPFTTSSPKKAPIPGPNDSGVSIRLGDVSTPNSSESDELEKLSPGDYEKSDLTIDIEDDKLDAVDDDEDGDSSQSSSVISIVSDYCGSKLKWIVLAILCMAYAGYFIWALVVAAIHKCDEDHDVVPLICLTVAALLIVIITFVKEKFSDDINQSVLVPLNKSISNHWHILKWILAVAPILGILAIIIVSAVQRPSNLISLMGWMFLVCVLIFCSRAPRKVKWRPVVGGFALQFYFATLILKWDKGYDMFNAVGKGFTTFLRYSEYGAAFVFGNLDDHFFAFKVLPVIIFFSCVITMLYHLRVMQVIIGKIAFVMRVTLGTTAAESLCAAGNIFVGQTEAPIMIRPFLALMTRSELHAVMVGGFGTIAGAVLAAYIMKGVPATHLLTACVMNAPTALAVSKILYPELGRSKIAKMREAIEQKNVYNNVIEAAAAGASAAISLVANVAANLIAFVALLYFVNSTISWLGSFVCHAELSFEVICSYVLMPLAYIMGVEWEDAGTVAELLGIKTFLNEFLAYDKLSSFIDNRVLCRGGTVISVRSEIIATYALCGFANLSSIGIQLGGLGPMAPNRLGDLAQLAVTALLGGIVTNLLTACVAGLLVIETPFDMATCLNTTVEAVMNGTVSAVVNGTVAAMNGTAI